MADQIERVTEETQNVDGRTEVVRSVSSESREGHVNQVARIVWFIIGVIVTLLLVRFVLALIGANLQNGFASFIYSFSDLFVAPFRGLLQVGEFQAGVSRFELETLVAAAIYILIGWGIAAAVRLLSRR